MGPWSPRTGPRSARPGSRPTPDEAQAKEHRGVPLPRHGQDGRRETAPRLPPVAAGIGLLAEPVVRVGDDAASDGPEALERGRPVPVELVEDAEPVPIHSGSALAHPPGPDAAGRQPARAVASRGRTTQ